MLSVHSIAVDARYQRGESRQKSMVIAREWNWDAYKALSVARRPDGSLFCYDGQHTLTGAILRGDISTLPCLVRDISEVASEAKAFLDGNSTQTQPSAYDRHRAAAIAGDKLASAVQEVLDKHGIIVVKGAYGPRKTTAIGAFYHVIGKSASNKDKLDLLIQRLLVTWPNDDMVVSGRFVEGMNRFLNGVAKQDPALIPKVLARLARSNTRYYLTEAEARTKLIRKPIMRTLVDFLTESYNDRLRADSRLRTIELD